MYSLLGLNLTKSPETVVCRPKTKRRINVIHGREEAPCLPLDANITFNVFLILHVSVIGKGHLKSGMKE